VTSIGRVARSGAPLACALLTAALAGAPAVAQAAAGAQDELRVVTFNIRYGTAPDGDNAWPNRRGLVVEVIRDLHAAVLGVQEALGFQLDEISEALSLEVVGVGRDDGVREGEFAAILVDPSRLDVLDHDTFWFSDTPETPGSASWGNRVTRICTWARLRDRASGRSFYLFNVHWDHESQPSRERSAGLLLERIAARDHPDEPVIVTGDFNAGEANPAFRKLIESPAVGLRDTYRELHPDARRVGTFNGFEGERDGDKIDAILVSEGWCVVEADIVRIARGGRYPSDHFPVRATVRRDPRRTCAAPDGDREHVVDRRRRPSGAIGLGDDAEADHVGDVELVADDGPHTIPLDRRLRIGGEAVRRV